MTPSFTITNESEVHKVNPTPENWQKTGSTPISVTTVRVPTGEFCRGQQDGEYEGTGITGTFGSHVYQVNNMFGVFPDELYED